MVRFGRGWAAMILALLLTGGTSAQVETSGVAAGIRQLESGDLEAAVATLEAALPAVEPGPAHDAKRVQAHLYLGMAHLGLGHEDEARTHLRRAFELNVGERLDPKVFPPRVIAIYDENRRGGKRPSDDRKDAAGRPLVTFGLGAVAGAAAVKLTGSGEEARAPSSPAEALLLRTLRLFNCDDRCRAWLNGDLLVEVGLGQDSGRLDLTNRLRNGANVIAFELENGHGGVTYGFEVRVGDAIVFQEVCGIVGRLGCEDDRSFPSGVVKRYEYVLQVR